MFGTRQSFRQNIGGHIFSGLVHDLHFTVLDYTAYKMMSHVDVLGPIMEDRVFDQFDSTAVVAV